MTKMYSDSIVVDKFPQYAYVLAILSGGTAYILTQLGGNRILPWLVYALLAALFSSIWPDRAMHWGGWLCLPIIMLLCFDVAVTLSMDGLSNNGTILAKALLSACLGAYIGSKLPVRRIASFFTNRRAKR